MFITILIAIVIGSTCTISVTISVTIGITIGTTIKVSKYKSISSITISLLLPLIRITITPMAIGYSNSDTYINGNSNINSKSK